MPSIPLYKGSKEPGEKGWYNQGTNRIAIDISIGHDDTSMLEDEAKHILSSNFEGPHWKSLKDAGIISQDHLDLIMKLDNNQHFKTVDGEKSSLEIIPEIPKLFLTLLESIRNENDLKYTLVLLYNTLLKDHSRSQLFEGEDLSIFLTLLTNPNDFIQNMAARVLSRIGFWKRGLLAAQDMEYYLMWIKTQFTLFLSEISSENKKYILNTVRCLQTS